MGIFDGFAEGLASAIDDVRHEFEIAAYGRQTTDDLVLPQAAEVEAPPIESPTIDLTGRDSDGWGVPAEWLADEPQVQPTSWAELSDAMQAQGMDAPQIDAPDVSAPSVDMDMGD